MSNTVETYCDAFLIRQFKNTLSEPTILIIDT